MEVLESVARQSTVLKEMLNTCVTLQPPDENNISMETGFAKEWRREVEEEVPLPTIHSDHLKIVVRWMEDHCDILEEDEGCLCNALDEKDAHLSNLEEDFLFELMLAANFLDVPGLLDALAKVNFVCDFSHARIKVVAVRLEGKTAGQIRQEFGIEGDLTGSEVEAIQEEEEWDTLVESLSG